MLFSLISVFCFKETEKVGNRIPPHICTHMEATLICFHNAEKNYQKSVRKHIRNTSEDTVRSTNYLFLACKPCEKKHVSLPLFLSALSHAHKAK